MPGSPSAVVLLGAQRFDPTLAAALSRQYVTGRVALITAGWQELESEDEELREHLKPRETVNLMLHARGEEVFRDDPELRAAHRARQDALRHRQDFYRIRVEHALEAERIIRKRPAPPDIAVEQRQASVDAIRELEETDRVRLLAQRFAPAVCVALPARSSLVFKDGRFVRSDGVIELREEGSHRPLEVR